ncbi:MAG: molybdate ABC transporter substrate-binding protein [Chloroflexi bacterium]|nr:molybdate ABC transporter substrate-binding protein [Chloroflexota bacterium]
MKGLFRASLFALIMVFVVGCTPGTVRAISGVAGGTQDPRSAAAASSIPVHPATLTVLAAASLTEPFTEIGDEFEALHPGMTIQFNFAGSQQLSQQIAEGAPADIFASANQTQMDVAIQAGGVKPGTAHVFVHNRLVVILPKGNPGQIHSLQDLAKPGLEIILAANAVPVGQYSLEFLQKASQSPAFGPAFEADVLKNVVSYEENVQAIVTKIALGEGDAGIVYTSDVQKADSDISLTIPDALNVIASYPIAAITYSKHIDQANSLIEFILSAQGQSILEKYGFIPAAS